MYGTSDISYYNLKALPAIRRYFAKEEVKGHQLLVKSGSTVT